MSCSHPHVWAYEGHVWCFVCKGLVSRSGEAECSELRARLEHEFLKANAATAYAKSYANSWHSALNQERERGRLIADDARKRALSMLDKERVEWRKEKTRMEARQSAERERITEDAEVKLRETSNQLACIRRGAERLTRERDNLIAEKEKKQKMSRSKTRSIGVGSGDVWCEDDIERLLRENDGYRCGMQAIVVGLSLLITLFFVLLVSLWRKERGY